MKDSKKAYSKNFSTTLKKMSRWFDDIVLILPTYFFVFVPLFVIGSFYFSDQMLLLFPKSSHTSLGELVGLVNEYWKVSLLSIFVFYHLTRKSMHQKGQAYKTKLGHYASKISKTLAEKIPQYVPLIVLLLILLSLYYPKGVATLAPSAAEEEFVKLSDTIQDQWFLSLLVALASYHVLEGGKFDLGGIQRKVVNLEWKSNTIWFIIAVLSASLYNKFPEISGILRWGNIVAWAVFAYYLYRNVFKVVNSLDMSNDLIFWLTRIFAIIVLGISYLFGFSALVAASIATLDPFSVGLLILISGSGLLAVFALFRTRRRYPHLYVNR